MTTEEKYHQLYDRLLEEVTALHRSNQRRIRTGMRALVIVTVGLMLLMFLAEGNKVFTLILWIVSMFALAAYLIGVEYMDYELQKKLQDITHEEFSDLGQLTALPQLERPVVRLPQLRRKGKTQQDAESADSGRAVTLPMPEEAARPVVTDEPAEQTPADNGEVDR